MYSICMEIFEQGRLGERLDSLAEAEKSFTREIGVRERRFFQCIQQPHVIWAYTRWSSEKAHNLAAAGIMKVRTDDRVAAAYFRPGLYFEIFGHEIEAAALQPSADEVAGFVTICHGLVSDRRRDRWPERFTKRADGLTRVDGLVSCRTFHNNYCTNEFVGFLGWKDVTAYENYRQGNDRTLEEFLFVGARHSELAAYVQYECSPLSVKR